MSLVAQLSATYSSLLRRLRSRTRITSIQEDELTVLANTYGSDKGSAHLNRHSYTRIYNRLFVHMRHMPIRFLEIGLLHFHHPGWGNNSRRLDGSSAGSDAPSLAMWSSYFSQASIYGFDINDFSTVSIPRCKIYRGDMGNRDDLTKLVDETGGRFDVIIDDASHASHHQQICLGFLFQHLSPGGLYVIEDLHYQPKEFEVLGAPQTRDVLKRFSAERRLDSPFMTPAERLYFEQHAAEIAFEDSQNPSRQVQDNLNALGVIHKIL